VIGLVGLGVMGRAVAARLTGQVPVIATSRSAPTRARAAAEVPELEVRDTPAEVVAALAGLGPAAPGGRGPDVAAGRGPEASGGHGPDVAAGRGPEASGGHGPDVAGGLESDLAGGPGPDVSGVVLGRLGLDVPLPVLVSVSGTAEVDEVVFGPDGLLAGLPAGRRLLLMDLSTTDPGAAADRHRRLAAAGHAALDVPVSGGPGGARSGTLSIMAGGTPDDLAAAGPLLARLGTVVPCGGPGAGQVAKACNQLVVASTLVAVAEALTLARRSGVDPAVVRDALLGGYAASRVLELQGELMLRRDFTGRGSAALLAKDVGIVQRLAGEAALDTPVLDAAGTVVRRLADRSPGTDHSAVVTIIEEGLS
jgi:2-hydroxy-3-oxopropionate reductase